MLTDYIIVSLYRKFHSIHFVIRVSLLLCLPKDSLCFANPSSFCERKKPYDSLSWLCGDTVKHRRKMYIEGKAKVVVDFWGKMAAC